MKELFFILVCDSVPGIIGYYDMRTDITGQKKIYLYFKVQTLVSSHNDIEIRNHNEKKLSQKYC